jgi:hypothetical protein
MRLASSRAQPFAGSLSLALLPRRTASLRIDTTMRVVILGPRR